MSGAEVDKGFYELARNELRLWAKGHGIEMDGFLLCDAGIFAVEPSTRVAKVALVKYGTDHAKLVVRLWFSFDPDSGCRHIEIIDDRP